VCDVPRLPEQLDQIPRDQFFLWVTADGTFETRTYQDVIAARGAVATILPRKSANPGKRTPGLVARSEALHGLEVLRTDDLATIERFRLHFGGRAFEIKLSVSLSCVRPLCLHRPDRSVLICKELLQAAC